MSTHRPRGLHGQTVELLAERILSNELAEGATLDLPALRAELDVSLTALREALKVLTAKGMIDARQKRGTFVQPRSSWNMLDADVMRWHTTTTTASTDLFDSLTEVRAVVEPAAARMAAARATDEEVGALAAALHRMAGARSTDEVVAADLEFHRVLLSATHNDFLVQIERVIAIGLAARDRLVHGAHPADDPVPSHEAVYAAIAARDEVAAEAAMRALVDKSSEDLQRVRPGK
ncbi:DNA-binding FadR family transcriptional regulator [Crossiella equi]|uniref:DNA-binding FadR family transcriptional regulator n=1 Tax=Crossiella equi TaxID=130796 RepID=A0ABS5A767_9PSEU|nr:FCD domain-containing protein [Crossiella equi]MBP2472444.1 DNA-binding FadR family transcriptional regulator [Crossiella equi]